MAEKIKKWRKKVAKFGRVVVLCCIVLYCIELYCIVLYCIVMHGFWQKIARNTVEKVQFGRKQLKSGEKITKGGEKN